MKKYKQKVQKRIKPKRDKLNPQAVREIKERIANGERQRVLAKAYGVSQATISRVKNNHEWQEVDCNVDVSQSRNYWSYANSFLADEIVRLYNEGYNEYEIPALIMAIVEKMDPDIRPKSCHQPDVHRILKMNGVKTRHPRAKRDPVVIEKVIQLRAQGLTYNEISQKLGIHLNTAWKYANGR